MGIETDLSKKNYHLNDYYYNIQRKRTLPFVYIFFTKIGILYTIGVIIYILYIVDGLDLFQITLIVLGYVYIFYKQYHYTYEDKEGLWFYKQKAKFLQIRDDDIENIEEDDDEHNY